MMKKRIIYFLIIFVALILQVSAVPIFFGQKFFPELVLMLMLAWTIRDGFADFLPWIVVAGILYDLLAYEPIGLHVIIFALSAYMVTFFSRRFSLQIRGVGMILLFAFVFVAMLFSRLFVLTFDFFENKSSLDFLNVVWRQLKFDPWIFFVNIALFMFCLWLIRRVKKYFYL